MKSQTLGPTALAIAFAAGALCSQLPAAFASTADAGEAGLNDREFSISVDEIRQNFVFGEKFKGSYTRTVEMSDGSKRTIELTPMVHDGMQVVEFKDNGFRTYMGLNGTTTNGVLMVQLHDVAASNAMLEQQGWKLGSR